MYAPAAAACHIITATARNVMARTQWVASDLWETSDPLFAFCWSVGLDSDRSRTLSAAKRDFLKSREIPSGSCHRKNLHRQVAT